MAPEVLATAKVQRWAPEEVLRNLVEAEIAARDESNHATRLKTANFPPAPTSVNIGMPTIACIAENTTRPPIPPQGTTS